jgi:hypothetical protein
MVPSESNNTAASPANNFIDFIVIPLFEQPWCPLHPLSGVDDQNHACQLTIEKRDAVDNLAILNVTAAFSREIFHNPLAP